MTDPSSDRETWIVALHTDDVSLVVDLSDQALPAVLHWGEAIPALTLADLPALAAASRSLNGLNDIDPTRRLAVVPEQHTGWTGRPGLQGSRAGRAWSTRFVVHAVTLDGVALTHSQIAGPGALAIHATDDEAQLALHLDLALDPSGLVRARATVTNLADEPFSVDGLTLALPIPAGHDELLDFGGRWGRERTPQRTLLNTGTHLREGRKGRTGADSAYVLHAGMPGFGFADGSIRAVHTGWSGNHVHYAEKIFTGDAVIGGGELLLPGEIVLGRDEAYASPWVFFGSGIGLDAVAHQFHRHLRARHRTVTTTRPVTLNVWEAVYFDHDLDRLIALAERAAQIGVERYVLDDGWFGSRRHDRAGLGDWVVSPDVWPDGLRPLIDRVRDLGMEFGLWFEPEMINPDSDAARAHPEWILSARRELPASSRYQQVLDLTNPEAYAHVLGQMSAILDEYDIGYLKWDHNRDLVEAGSPIRGGRPAVHDQTTATYRLLDELRSRYPDLDIESCSSGGARVDLGILERTDRVWVSDVIDPLERQHMLRWTTQLIPPEFMGSHIASDQSHSTGRMHHLSFRAGTALFGHLGIEWDLTAVDDATLADLAEWVDAYKAHRDLVLGGTLVRVDVSDPNVLVHGVVSPDQSAAIFSFATVGNPISAPGPRVRFPGLAPDGRYRVRPLIVGRPASGLVAPPWWGHDVNAGPPGDVVSYLPHDRAVQRGAQYPGIVLSGAALATVGTAAPLVHPDQVVLFEVSRQDEASPR